MSVQEEDVSYVSPHRDLCDVHASEKCISDFKGGTRPRPVELDMYVICNMCVQSRAELPLKCLMYMGEMLLHLEGHGPIGEKCLMKTNRSKAMIAT